MQASVRRVTPGGFLSSISSLKQIIGSSNVSVVGLKNIGNTCFLNAVLQSLASVKSFHFFLGTQPNHKDMQLTCAFKETLAALSTKRDPFEPPVTRVPSLRKRFLTREQQDAHEFMQFVITILTEESENVSQGTSLFTAVTQDVRSPFTYHSVFALKPLPPILSNFTSTSTSTSFTSSSSFLPSNSIPTSASTSGFGLGAITELSSSFLSSSSPYLTTSLTNSTLSTTDAAPSSSSVYLKKRNPFTGLLKGTLECAKCGNPTSVPSYQKFIDLSLSIPESFLYGTTKRPCSLQQCLRSFTNSELVSEVNCPTCTKNEIQKQQLLFEKKAKLKMSKSRSKDASNIESDTSTSSIPQPEFKVKTTARKKLAVARAPKILCLHIRRLVGMNSFVKLNCHIDFPLELDLSPYCSFGGEKNTESMLRGVLSDAFSDDTKNAKKCCSIMDSSFNQSSPSKSSCVGGHSNYKSDQNCGCSKKSTEASSTSENSSFLYQLVAVIVHHGDQSGGHYTVYRRSMSDLFNNESQYDQYIKSLESKTVQETNDLNDVGKGWVHISDEVCRNVSVDEVLAAQAYMLYYERYDPKIQ